jgi:hypothetical protein
MTVSALPRTKRYNGSGSTGPFTWNFRTLASADIRVTRYNTSNVLTSLNTPTDYTITLVGNGRDGGSLTLTTALATGEKLLIESIVAKTQPTNYNNQADFFPETHGNSFDRITIIAQEIAAVMGRSIAAPAADDEDNLNMTLPLKASRASKVLGFDADGEPAVSSLTLSDLDSINGSISSIAASVSAASASATAAAASAAQLVGTSVTSTTIGTGSKSFTTQGGKFFTVPTRVLISSDADPTNRNMFGTVTAYNSTTGALTVDIAVVTGTGTFTDWTIRVAGERGATGATGAQGAPGSGTGDMLRANNLSDVVNAATAFNNIKQAASASATGVVELATDAEAITGTDTTRATTPANVKAVLDLFGFRGYIAGLVLSNNGSDANNDIDISAGVARDSTNAVSMVLASALTKRLDESWAVGTNQGGLDTGSKTSDTWYHIWLIRRPDTSVVDVLFSKSASAPTMPTNYTQKRLIGSVYTEGTNLKAFFQQGDFVFWSTPIYQTVAASATPANATVRTPLGRSVVGYFNFQNDSGQAIYAYDPSAAAIASGTSNAGCTQTDNFSGQGLAPAFVRTNTSSQIKCVAQSGGVNIAIRTLGYIDTRGRDD